VTSNASVFSELAKKGTNFSVIFGSITRTYLRRTDWVTNVRSTANGIELYTAWFKGEMASGATVTFSSKNNIGGIEHDNKWWFQSEHEARASAFDDFLDYFVGKGIISRDKRLNLETGQPIRY